VFRASSTDGLAGLVALAEGWPAVIGLASLTERDHLDGVVPETLYEYFADELYQAAGPTLQRALPELALSPHLTLEMATSFFGPRRGRRLLEEACNLGFMTMTANRAELHPLLARSYYTSSKTFLTLGKKLSGRSRSSTLSGRHGMTYLRLFDSAHSQTSS
jgi:hypothetical protein